MMISRHADMPIDFDFAKVLEQSRDNPIFYIQYAHARICSVLRHAQSLFPHMDLEKLKDANLERLTEDAEFAMIKIISEWPKQVETAALCREPHRIATYLYDVASEFHALWNKGKEKTQLRFIHVEDEAETCAKLALILAVQNVIASGLLVFGITPTQEMR
jgi:arginyl-tRNA synthetase